MMLEHSYILFQHFPFRAFSASPLWVVTWGVAPGFHISRPRRWDPSFLTEGSQTAPPPGLCYSLYSKISPGWHF